MMKKVLFIDRDGTIILETHSEKIDTFEKLAFYPNVFYWLGRIVREFNFELVLVTNQDGLGSSIFPDEPFFTTHHFIMKTFADQGISFAAEFIDRTYPKDNQPTRKPGTAMLTHYIDNNEYDLKNSFVIGDRITDVVLAKNLGCKAMWLNNGSMLGSKEIKYSVDDLGENIAVNSPNWEDIYDYLVKNKTH